MSGKSKKKGESSGDSACKMSDQPAPNSDEDAKSEPCGDTHWIGIKVVDEKGKTVDDVVVSLKASDGSVRTIDLSTVKLEKGVYKTRKNLPDGPCEVTFPQTLDIEWKAK